jgi:hypothetical protein
VAYKLTVEELQNFHDELSRTRQTYRRIQANDVDAESYREFATALNDRWEAHESELASGNTRVGLSEAEEAIDDMNHGMGSLANELRHLARLLDIYNDPDRSRSDRESDEALDTHKRRLDEVQRLITGLMAQVKEVEKMLRRSGGSGIRNLSEQHDGHFWPDVKAAGAEYPW